MDTRLDLVPRPTLAESFAADEHLAEGEGTACARLWRHGPAIVAGGLDMRLPRAQEALAELHATGRDVHVRSSGGRLVVLDGGVLNIALAFSGTAPPGIDGGFRLLADLLCRALERLALPPSVGEVRGAICPGRHDIAVGGRKVAGLAQRRRRNFALLHAFLLVEGRGRERERVARDFYRLAGAPPEQTVLEGSMAALAELRRDVSLEGAAGVLQDLLRDLQA